METIDEAATDSLLLKQKVQHAFPQKTGTILNSVFIITNLIIVYLVFKHSPISDDAAYYLVIAREIANGITPYADITVIYTPFVLYLNSIIFRIAGDFNYSHFILLHLAVVLACAFTIYFIFHKKFTLPIQTSLILSILFFTSILSFEGYYVVTEPYVILFILLSFYIVYNRRNPLPYIFSGIILSFSFFSKQYGLFAVIPFVLFMYTSTKINKAFICFIAAYAFSIGLFFIFFSYGHVDLLWNQLFVIPFAAKSDNLSVFPSLLSFISFGKIFLLLMIPFVVRVIKSRFSMHPVFIFSLIGLVIYVAPTVLNQFQHYFINTFPFIFIFYGYTINKLALAKYEKVILAIVSFILAAVIINRLLVHADKKREQLSVSDIVRSHFKNGENVFVMGKYRSLYLLNDYQNPVKQQLSYTWNYHYIQQQHNALNHTNIVFSSCYEKTIFLDSLKIKPASFVSIEDCTSLR